MLQLENVQSVWLWLLGIVAVAALLFVVYRSIFQRPERRLTWVLLALRGAGILALLLALARPVWTQTTTLTAPGRLAIVLDDSRSMSLAHTGGKSRYEWALEAVTRLKRQVEEGEGARVQVELFGIDGKPIEAGKMYRVTVNSFLASGGDGFEMLRDARQIAGGPVDLDAFEAYLRRSQGAAAPAPRITKAQ